MIILLCYPSPSSPPARPSASSRSPPLCLCFDASLWTYSPVFKSLRCLCREEVCPMEFRTPALLLLLPSLSRGTECSLCVLESNRSPQVTEISGLSALSLKRATRQEKELGNLPCLFEELDSGEYCLPRVASPPHSHSFPLQGSKLCPSHWVCVSSWGGFVGRLPDQTT